MMVIALSEVKSDRIIFMLKLRNLIYREKYVPKEIGAFVANLTEVERKNVYRRKDKNDSFPIVKI